MHVSNFSNFVFVLDTVHTETVFYSILNFVSIFCFCFAQLETETKTGTDTAFTDSVPETKQCANTQKTLLYEET